MIRYKSFVRAAWLIGLTASFAAAQSNLAFFPIVPSDQPTGFSHAISLPNGNRLAVGSFFNIGRQQLVLSSMTPSGVSLRVVVGTFDTPLFGGHGNDFPADVAVDPSGNIWIVGSSDSDDFILVNPIVATKLAYRREAFVLEMDPTLSSVLFSTYLGGKQPGNDCFGGADVIAFDPAGNAYIGGSTDEPDFPTTPGAYRSNGSACRNAFGEFHEYSFLTKISPSGKLVFSTLLDTGAAQFCIGGSACIGKKTTYAYAGDLAVDSNGTVTVDEVGSNSASRVVRISPDGSKLLWSTPIGGVMAAMAQDSSRNVYVLSEYVNEQRLGNVVTSSTYGLAASKIGSDGSVAYTLDLGGASSTVDGQPAVYGVLVDSAGNAYYAGSSTGSPQLSDAPNLGADFILQLDTTGSTVKKLFRFPKGVIAAKPAIDAADKLLLLGAHGALVTLPTNYKFDTPLILGFANSASYDWNTGIYPGTLVSIFGYNLGPAQVSVDGFSAPVIYTGSTQINTIVPFGVSGLSSYPRTPMRVDLPTATISLNVPGIFSMGLFTTDGSHAAALNQDGTVNSATNPATAGSVISVFGTGAVWPSDLGATGAEEFDQSANGFVIGAQHTLLYFGAAPGQYVGVFQANVQLPPPPRPGTAGSGGITLQRLVNPLSSNSVVVYVK